MITRPGLRNPDGGWVDLGAAVNRGRDIITARGITSLSQFAVAEGAVAPLPPLPVFLRGDPDGNGTVQLTDGIFLLNFLFLGGDSIPAPFPECGGDPGEDPLGCEGYDHCP